MYNRMHSVDYSNKTSNCDSNNTYDDNNLDYPGFRFKYVPYNVLFDAVDCNPRADYLQSKMANNQISLQDYGPQPYVVNINKATKQNNNFRTALWTGEHLQVTLMSINVGDDIGLEIHPNID